MLDVLVLKPERQIQVGFGSVKQRDSEYMTGMMNDAVGEGERGISVLSHTF